MPQSNPSQLNCLIDCRISSTRQQSGGGLDDQKSVCLSFVNRNGWHLLKTYSKVYSGRAEEREDFEAILKDIRGYQAAGTKVHYYVVKSIDRFTRDGAVTYDEMKGRLQLVGVQLADAYGLIQPEQNTLAHLGVEYKWSKRSPTASAQLAEAQRAKDEVTDILTRMIGAEIALTREGYKVRAPNDGYLNQQIMVDGKKRFIQVPDPERAKYYRAMFTLRAEGALTDDEIVKRVNAMGYRSKMQNRWDAAHERVIGQTGGLPLTVKRLQAVIRKPAYAGVICERWTHGKPVKAKYDGLVSIEVWNQANRRAVEIVETPSGIHLLYNQEPERTVQRRLRENPLYPYKWAVACSSCRKPFLGSSSRGKSGKGFPAYHCSRGHRYVRVKKTTLETTLEAYVRTIRLDPRQLAALRRLLLRAFRQQERTIGAAAKTVASSVAALEAEQATKLAAIPVLTSAVVRQKLEAEIEALEARIAVARAIRHGMRISEADIEEFLENAKYLVEHHDKLLLNTENQRLQRSLFGLVFAETPTYDEIANGTPKLAWIFSPKPESEESKTSMVALRRLGWNTIEETILTWKEVFATVRLYRSIPAAASNPIRDEAE